MGYSAHWSWPGLGFRGGLAGWRVQGRRGPRLKGLGVQEFRFRGGCKGFGSLVDGGVNQGP